MSKILLTNDDGWDAPGIKALREVLEDFGEVTTVAPATPQSGISHQMTFEVPMTLTQQSDRAWHLTGTPADCARVGISQLNEKFDWVFSGINNGGNLGIDYFISGTVAAAREATFFGLRAVAISQHRLNYPESFDWTKSQQLARRVIEYLMEPAALENQTVAPGALVSVNLPDCSHGSLEGPQIVECPRDSNPLPYTYVDSPPSNGHNDPTLAQQSKGAQEPTTDLGVRHLIYQGAYNSRARDSGKDIDVCLSGNISITRQ